MRFCDLFISYKIGLKGIKNLIPITKLPFYRKIAVILIFVFTIFEFLFHIFHLDIIVFGIFIIEIIFLIVFTVMNSTKRNLTTMLNEHYLPYSHQRMTMIISVLKSYHINYSDATVIDQLIVEAESAQIQCDYIAPLKKPLKTLSAIIVPIIVFVAQKIANSSTNEDILNMALQYIVIILLIFSLIMATTPILKSVLYRDYNKYDDFISDLKQLKLFYCDNTQNPKFIL